MLKDFFKFIHTSCFEKSCTTSDGRSILEIKKHKGEFLINLKGVNDYDQAKSLTKHRILSSYIFPNSLYLAEVVGFLLYDKHKQLGQIKSFYHNNAHGVLSNGTCEIPFVENWIDKIDWTNRKVIMNLPEGLNEI